MRESILCIGFPKWEGDYMKSTVQLLSELAAYHDILYVEYPFTLTDLWRGLRRRGDAPVGRLLGTQDRLRRYDLPGRGHIHVLTLPPFLPTNWIDGTSWYERLTRWNARLALPAIRRAMRRLDFGAPVVINAFQPALGRLLRGRFGEKLLLYYCYDEIAAAPWIGKHGGRSEREFLALADAVVTSSRQLALAKSPLAPRCYIVRNGVDTRLFNPQNASGPPPLERGRYRHLVGYLGSVDLRLDYRLLGEVITSMPGTLFAFVGRCTHEAGRQQLAACDNVRLLGPQPPSRLPDYVRAFDAGIIPFLDNDLTRGIYPLKVNEYLAMGKPVVTTRFGDISDFNDITRIARCPTSFRAALTQALHEQNTGLTQRRTVFARANSWRRRAARFDAIIRELIADKEQQHRRPQPFTDHFGR